MPTPAEELISPDAAVLLEDLLRLGRIRRAAFCERWGVSCIAWLPLSRWGEASAWINEQAAARGYEVPTRPHPDLPPPPAEPTLPQLARKVVDNVGARRAGGSLFEDSTY